jgi:hypothetical protein
LDAQDHNRKMREKRRSALGDAVRNAALSGAAGGAVLGGAGRLLGGTRKFSDLLKGMAQAAGISGGLAAGSTGLGTVIMGGTPDEDDPHGFTHRGALGGAVGGTLLGAGLGALVGRGVLKAPGKNLVSDYFRNLAKRGGAGGLLHGAAAGALGGGAVAGYQGADEGMQLDFLRSEVQDSKRRKRAALMAEIQGLEDGHD